MRNITFKLILLPIIFLLALSAGNGLAQEDEETVIPIQFVTHVQFGSAEQDVYLDNGDGTVRRVTPAEEMASLYAPLYATATMTEHDPFAIGENPFGPFEQDIELGFTLVEWVSATGSGTYTVDGDHATIEVEFKGLVPKMTARLSRLLMNPAVNRTALKQTSQLMMKATGPIPSKFHCCHTPQKPIQPCWQSPITVMA